MSARSWRARGSRSSRCCCRSAERSAMSAHPGWPAELAAGPVRLRPPRMRDGRAWSEVRLRNERWLAPWEPTSALRWVDRNGMSAWPALLSALRKDARAGRGITPTSLALVIDHCFTSVALHRVEVDIRPENAASVRVVEKLGLRREGYYERFLDIDGAWRDHVAYAVTVEELGGRTMQSRLRSLPPMPR